MDSKIDVTAILFILVQNRHQTHDCTLIGSGDNGHGIQERNKQTEREHLFGCNSHELREGFWTVKFEKSLLGKRSTFIIVLNPPN